MKHIVIDLEMCKVPKSMRKKYPYKQEIIQIGAVLLNEDFEEISRFSAFVKPEFGHIDWFIADLTGIHDTQVKHAPMLAEVLERMQGWIGKTEADIYAWSDSDRAQLMHEITEKQIELPGLSDFMAEENWVDYQKIFGKRFSMGRDVSLKEAMNLADIEQEGRAHDGLEDARNTGRLIAKLELDPDYQLPEVYEKARSEEEPEHLGFSMGSLFAGLALEF